MVNRTPGPALEVIYAEQEMSLSPESTDALQAFARQNQLTLNTLLQGAWALLLSRYSGGEDVVFGATVSGRPAELAGSDSMVGLFINTLPVRVSVPPQATVLSYLRRLQEQQTDARQYEYSSLAEIQAYSDVPHGTPLFDSLLVYENYPFDPALLAPGGDLKIEEVHSFEQTNYALTLAAGARPNLALKLSYDTRQFDEDTIRRMLGHLKTFLEGLPAGASALLSSLPLLTPAERQQILIDWNQTEAPFPDHACVHQLFEARVRELPDSIALIMDERQVTYGELNQRSNRLAHYLRKRGVQPETVVAIYAERSIEMIVAILGVLKAGGAYLPLDPAYPADRLGFMLSDAAVELLLTQSDLFPNLPENGAEAIFLDADWASIELESGENPENLTRPQHLAYVIYTSGSTGQPKGALLEHRGLVNFAYTFSDVCRITRSSRVLQFSSFGFDASVQEIFCALLLGGALVLTRRETLLSPPDLLGLLRQQHVTAVTLPPSMLAVLPGEDLPELSSVISAGEQCQPALVRKWARGRHFVNAYGPTEATIGAVARSLHFGAESTPIGRPLANVQVYVLDSNRQPVPIGVPGELYIGGVGVARGYLNRPELNEKKFLPHPFAAASGERIYRTGDLVLYLPDGDLEFLGRIDHQIKLRGFRIELGEIEAILRSHPAVEEAVLLPHENGVGEKYLAAYLVLSGEASFDEAGLRSFVRSKLPEYMLPAVYIRLDRLPLTPSGKIDRKALPAPDHAHLLAERVYVAPRTPTQEILANICLEILGVPRLGIQDDFFELGGHSLLVTQIISRIRGSFQVELPLSTLFEAPTVEELSARIDAAMQAGQRLELPPILPAPRDDAALPLSFSQQRLWFLDQLDPGNLFYNIPTAARLSGDLDVEALRHSLNEIVRRHEALRTTFASAGGKAAQVIAPSVKIELPVIDLSSLPAAEREAAADKHAAWLAQQPFDLSAGPLLRAALLRLDKNDHVAVFCVHHIVADGWSLDILMRELASLYQAYASGKEPLLPDLSIQYADYAVWQRNWLQGEVLEGQLAYWKQQLTGSPPLLDLPTDHPRPAVKTSRGASQFFDWPTSLRDALLELCKKEGVTLYMALLAAFQTLLYRYSGQEDVCVGSAVANRTHKEIEGLIGFFVNTLVMRTNLSGEPTFRELLKRVREVALGAYAHQDLPFETLVDALQPGRNLSFTPLFQVGFAVQNEPPSGYTLPGLSLTPMPVHSGTAAFDLLLSITDSPQGLKGALEYNLDLYDPPTVSRMLEHFRVLLEAVVSDPEQPISLLPLLTEGERRQILMEWNATRQDFAHDQTIHQRFEAQAEKDPGALALSFEGQALTYGELNRRANQLAHFLKRFGVGPGVLVGISTERSLEMIVGILGVLKAGGAYLPLDPNYPAERIAFMLADSQVPVLLTQEHLLSRLPAGNHRLIRLDADWGEIARQSGENLPCQATPEDLAYVIYTSGSTGKPKGALLGHRGLVNLAEAQRRAFEITPESRVLQFSPFSFDASVWETVMALANGAALVLARQAVLASPPELLHLFEEEGITTVTLPPSLLSILPSKDLPALRTIIAAGESCPQEIVKRWAPGRRFFNAYGPTETTVCASMYLCNENDPLAPPIGRPLDNAQLFILDAHLQPVPVGIPGELLIGGVGLAHGYLNRPELSAEKFIRNPFSPHSDQRLYKTGDLARYLPDGNVEFLGRIDNQVKVRGFRIELGEIEAALRLHPSIRETAVLAREDVPGDRRLVAYFVSEDGIVPGSAELRSFLRENLPEYMLPSAFVSLEAFPQTPSGKVDRKALPAPDQSRPALAIVYVPPRTPVEETLAAICEELLGVEQVGIYDNFFELGGHSLLATQFMSRVRDAFHVELPLRAVFEKPTIADLAGEIEQARRESGAGVDKIAELLGKIEGLTQDEVQALLADKGGADD